MQYSAKKQNVNIIMQRSKMSA